MRPALFAILAADALLLCVVGAASYALARSALAPLVVAREREERFSADVAHELRTPLGAIASIAQTTAADDASAAAAALRSIARRATESGELIADLLTLARASEVESLDCEPVDLAIVADHARRERTAERRITLACECESAIVIGDERRLRQLVRNLLDNAFAHARSRVDLVVTTRNGTAELCVEDDGPGLDPEVLPHLFERFAKGRASSGSGLGLAICRWIVRAHGGDLTYLGGSRFVARFPEATNPMD